MLFAPAASALSSNLSVTADGLAAADPSNGPGLDAATGAGNTNGRVRVGDTITFTGSVSHDPASSGTIVFTLPPSTGTTFVQPAAGTNNGFDPFYGTVTCNGYGTATLTCNATIPNALATFNLSAITSAATRPTEAGGSSIALSMTTTLPGGSTETSTSSAVVPTGAPNYEVAKYAPPLSQCSASTVGGVSGFTCEYTVVVQGNGQGSATAFGYTPLDDDGNASNGYTVTMNDLPYTNPVVPVTILNPGAGANNGNLNTGVINPILFSSTHTDSSCSYTTTGGSVAASETLTGSKMGVGARTFGSHLITQPALTGCAVSVFVKHSDVVAAGGAITITNDVNTNSSHGTSGSTNPLWTPTDVWGSSLPVADPLANNTVGPIPISITDGARFAKNISNLEGLTTNTVDGSTTRSTLNYTDTGSTQVAAGGHLCDKFDNTRKTLTGTFGTPGVAGHYELGHHPGFGLGISPDDPSLRYALHNAHCTDAGIDWTLTAGNSQINVWRWVNDAPIPAGTSVAPAATFVVNAVADAGDEIWDVAEFYRSDLDSTYYRACTAVGTTCAAGDDIVGAPFLSTNQQWPTANGSAIVTGGGVTARVHHHFGTPVFWNKLDSADPVTAGDQLDYQFPWATCATSDCRAQGGAGATPTLPMNDNNTITLTDTLPAGLTFVSTNAPTGSAAGKVTFTRSGQNLTWVITGVPGGASQAALTAAGFPNPITVTVATDPTLGSPTSTVNQSALTLTDPNGTTGTPIALIAGVYDPNETTSILTTSVAEVFKTVSSPEISKGGPLSFTLGASNTSNFDIETFDGIDLLPWDGDPRGSNIHSTLQLSDIVITNVPTGAGTPALWVSNTPQATLDAHDALNTDGLLNPADATAIDSAEWPCLFDPATDILWSDAAHSAPCPFTLAQVTAVRLVGADPDPTGAGAGKSYLPSHTNGAVSVRLDVDTSVLDRGDVVTNTHIGRFIDPASSADNVSVGGPVTSRLTNMGVGNRLFHDLNGNGLYDTGEPGIAGVTVELVGNATGTVVGTSTTDANGYWFIDEHDPGTFYVRIPSPPAGAVPAPNAADPDNGIEADHSLEDQGGVFRTDPFTLVHNGEPTSEADQTGRDAVRNPDDDTDMTVDLALIIRNPAISIDKTVADSNGDFQAADTAPGVYLPAGTDADFEYTVTNNGDTVLTNIVVVDDKHVAVNCPKTTLAVGEHMVCDGSGPIGKGQYTNVGTVTADDPGGTEVTDHNPANAFGSDPSVSIEKDVRDATETYQPADTAPGVYLPAGTDADFRYTVTNTGNTTLTNIEVTDDKGLAVTCAETTLAPGIPMACTARGPIGSGGHYTNIGTATGDDPVGTEVTDDNPANVFGSDSGIAIEKDVLDATGAYQPADTAPGVYLPANSEAVFRYTVRNTGNTALTDVTVTDDKGLDVTCPGTTLAVDATMACDAAGPIGTGQYTNIGTATGQDPAGTTLTATNPANVYGSASGIAIEKDVRDATGTYQPADTAPGVYLPANARAEFRYTVTNTGNTDLTDVTVTDDQGLEVTCPDTSLAVGDDMECTASGPIGTGQYTNVGTATGTDPSGDTLTAANPANAFGGGAAIAIRKDVQDRNGTWQAADAAPGVHLPAGATARFRYIVTNNGNTALRDVTVTDDRGVDVTCPKAALAVDESMTCTGSGPIGTGQYTNIGTVTADGGGDTVLSASNPANAIADTRPTPTPDPSPNPPSHRFPPLPRTGGDWVVLLALGLGLIAIGGGFMLFGRRRGGAGAGADLEPDPSPIARTLMPVGVPALTLITGMAEAGRPDPRPDRTIRRQRASDASRWDAGRRFKPDEQR